jgi:cyclohexyl-isocyanide hydratase
MFEDLDQIDLTGPFEVLSRIPNATRRIYAESIQPVRDAGPMEFESSSTFGSYSGTC